jgi:hypothetical protein
MLKLRLRLGHRVVQQVARCCSFPAVLSVLILGCPRVGQSQTPSSGLYGITLGGKLATVDLTTAELTQVRALPAQSNYCYNLAYYNNKFYTQRAIGPDASGSFYRFGITSGDEENLGTLAHIYALAVRPSDHKIFAVTQSGSVRVLREVVISGTPPTATLSGTAISIGPYGNNFYNSSLFGLTFYKNDVAVLINSFFTSSNQGVSNVFQATISSSTGQILAQPNTQPHVFRSGAVEPTNEKIYVIKWLGNATGSDSELWEYKFSPPSATRLGQFAFPTTGTDTVNGLAFVPLPSPVATPTAAPTYTPAKVIGFEPIRKKLMGE